jgi:integrase/recombinase XerD
MEKQAVPVQNSYRMKRLPLTSPHYLYIEKSFKEWLDILGYAEHTVYSMPNYIRGLLHHIEQKGKTQITDITRDAIKEYYYNHLKNRPNMLYNAGGLSNSHLNKHIQAFYKFCDYLRQSGRLIIPTLDIQWEERAREMPAVLTEEEIEQLYKACDMYPQRSDRKPQWLYPALALRDKAMLAVYYGCGLRRNEGLHIELSDILFDKQLLYVRKGKNYKERFVPISKAGIKHLENYLYDARPYLIKHNKEEIFFINERGKRMQGQMMLLRLDQLVTRTENVSLQEKEIGLHTLRHSIATHLLANGMRLEKIKDFLGHDSLESTQIYTHLIETENENY